MAYEDYVGKKIGNYEILELVGKGGMAGVFRAVQPSVNRPVAIKMMSQQLSEDDKFVERFKYEAEIIARLEHAHILPVYDFGDENGQLYIVMRYLPGGDLDDKIGTRGMDLEEVVPIFKQIASALDHAHGRGIIHRDLKPGNIMIDEQNNAFLTDFGIAKSVEGTTNLTGTGGVVGTPTYMSPEQGLGETVDHRSDVYALGVVIFEVLTGRLPFTAENPMAMMLKHINEPAPSACDIKPELPPAVCNVILRAMSKDPEARFQTAGELATALEKAARGVEPDMPPSTEPLQAPSATLKETPSAGSTMPSPVAGAPQPATAAGGAVGPAVPTIPGQPPMPASTMAGARTGPALPRPISVTITLNNWSAWLAERSSIGTWMQAALLSLSTFLILSRLTQGAAVEIGLLSLIPGLLLYGLLRTPTLAAIISVILILLPLLAHSPGLAIVWFAFLFIAGSRLNHIETMLALVTLIAAGSPLGWIVPLLAPWYLRARRSVLGIALGVTFAMLFALTLGWPNAGGLLPTPLIQSVQTSDVVITPFDTTYLGLLEPSVWAAWGGLSEVSASIRVTFEAMGNLFNETDGLPLLVAAAWAVAATLTVSNRRVQSGVLRAGGIALGLVVLMVAQVLPGGGVLVPANSVAVLVGLSSGLIAFLLTQWPLQVDPNKGNLTGTVMRMLRQTLGAMYVALGVAFFSRYLSEAPLFAVVWILGSMGTLTMITNPMLGPPLVFTALVIGFVSGGQVTLGIIAAVLLVVYLLINLFFDRRRPRRWNPLGAGLILGGPGLAQLGVLSTGVLSIGALEAQVPAALLALMGHVLLLATVNSSVQPLAIVVQLIVTLIGIFVIERMMSLGTLGNLPHKLRRLIFTLPTALVMAAAYYTVGQVAQVSVVNAIVVSVITAAALVGAMGDRANYWREFFDRPEEEEDILEDEEVTGAWTR